MVVVDVFVIIVIDVFAVFDAVVDIIITSAIANVIAVTDGVHRLFL